ncbi:hypothetical protein [Leeuwenhoekiella marinoflava]|uniref:Uncharacterized protein n=2 Tax=Leeuwenhoekiella marinoflava TaxID=988 RepID=A0A4Q0PPI5_9FLAO|nr:hypothetical protein [Leeuwenhoekiella marinoflava]RXG32364.1 hypothetical protein DSL99_1170 [Leeuwenhoekiella marinoflava]SHE77701.1 hypothetical protein SAMN02745246_00989 [Leeuwenhoekiella marinoflava DSM 3653]
MNTSPNIHFENALIQLLKRYNCSKKERNRLKTVDLTKISKISHTEYGGFEEQTGAFLNDAMTNTFKIKIDYIDQETRAYKKLYLVPNTEEQEELIETIV